MKTWKFIQRSTLLPGLSTWALGWRGLWQGKPSESGERSSHSAYLLCNLSTLLLHLIISQGFAVTCYQATRMTRSRHANMTEPMASEVPINSTTPTSPCKHPRSPSHHHPGYRHRGAVNQHATGPQLNRRFAFCSLLCEFPPNKRAKLEEKKKKTGEKKNRNNSSLHLIGLMGGSGWASEQQSWPKAGPHHHLLPCQSQRTKKE